MRSFLLLCLLFYNTIAAINSLNDQKIQRGEFHDEGKFIVDYEDFSTNLTDYASRRTSDDDKMTPEDQNRNDETRKSGEVDESDDSSDISEERERDSVDHQHLKSLTAIKPEKHQPVAGVINSAFNDRKTFSCPRTKLELVTGTFVGDVSPEDITIIAAMGDALATGIGLWPNADIEFRGASFPIGGDSTIDGLITIPNILREFSPKIIGVSHGMGADLPDHQLNVAQTGATTKDLYKQAVELTRRVKKLTEVDYLKEWIMIIITIGTEEICSRCDGPSYDHIKKAIEHLQIEIPKALVVLLGPVHVSSFHEQKSNLLKNRCQCSRDQTEGFMYDVSRKWSRVWKDLQKFVETGVTSRPTFGMISYPMVTITSRYPNGLFIRDKPLLNRRGHNYATKWLWNRLIGGDLYNLSSATLSQDNYFCPSVGCPYFRTYANHVRCLLRTHQEAAETDIVMEGSSAIKKRRRTIQFLYNVAMVVVGLAFLTVFILGTYFYQKSKAGDHGRFEIVEEPQKKLEEAQKEEQKALLTRQNTRAQSEQATTPTGGIQLAPISVGRHKSFLGTISESNPDA
uniref:Lipase_GDSL domain-containing protein n=1 Tax=Caenorhabditis tropicalis TaxID=1561998 RepID=A0A1I7UY98_9PELO